MTSALLTKKAARTATVRPETLTLLYLSIFLAVVSRWDRLPAFAWVLPLVQVAWVNSQGLFVLGPIVVICGLIGAVLRPGAFAPERRRWWRTVGIAGLAIAAACLVNPYGITGALYPATGDPSFLGRLLDPSYVTTRPGTRGVFYGPTADPAVGDPGTGAAGGFASLGVPEFYVGRALHPVDDLSESIRVVFTQAPKESSACSEPWDPPPM